MANGIISLFLSIGLFTGISIAQVSFNPDSIKGPVCVITDSATGRTALLSPVQSQYNVVITDGFANLRLTQKFRNTFVNVRDIVYVFPLPHEGSVHAMSMEYKGQIYRAKIYERTQAQHMYDSVVAAGKNAALLVQDRPNIFQQHLANIAAGDSAFVRIDVIMPLKYDSGVYELAIPTMIGERFQSAGVAPVPSTGMLWNPPETRDGKGIQVNVLLQTGYPVTGISSPTHAITVDELAIAKVMLVQRGLFSDSSKIDMPYTKGIMLAQGSTCPNRDFVLRFGRSAIKTDFTFASQYNGDYGKGHFAINIFPDDTMFGANERMPLDIVLLIDISGSQNGLPLQKEKEIAVNILNRLQITDRVTLLAFSDQVYWGFGKPDPAYATADTVRLAINYVNGLQTIGGTQLLSGVNAALATPASPERQRYYIFLTDGFITNETAILDAIKNHPSHPTVFTFGAGNNLNRYFLDQCALVGNGYATEVILTQDVKPLVDAAWVKIESPQLTNITFDFGTVSAADLVIPRSAVLYKGCPVTVYGTYLTGGASTVTVTGMRLGKEVTIEKDVIFTKENNMNGMLPQIWAKQMIEKLMIDQGTGTTYKDSIIKISMQYQVLSNYTAFLAINPESMTADNSISGNMNGAFTELKKSLLVKMNAMFELVIKGCSLNVKLSNDYIDEIVVCDLFGRVLYRFRPSKGSMLNRFAWDGTSMNGGALVKGRYILKVKTREGRLICRAFVLG